MDDQPLIRVGVGCCNSRMVHRLGRDGSYRFIPSKVPDIDYFVEILSGIKTYHIYTLRVYVGICGNIDTSSYLLVKVFFSHSDVAEAGDKANRSRPRKYFSYTFLK